MNVIAATAVATGLIAAMAVLIIVTALSARCSGEPPVRLGGMLIAGCADGAATKGAR